MKTSDIVYMTDDCYIIKRNGYEVYKTIGMVAKKIGTYGSSNDFSEKWLKKAKERCDNERN